MRVCFVEIAPHHNAVFGNEGDPSIRDQLLEPLLIETPTAISPQWYDFLCLGMDKIKPPTAWRSRIVLFVCTVLVYVAEPTVCKRRGCLIVLGSHGVEWVKFGGGGQFQALFDGPK